MRNIGPLSRRVAVVGALRRRALFTQALATVFAAAPLFARGTPAAAATQLRIGGTGMGLATIREVGTAFTAANRDVAVNVLPSLGTGGGLNAVAAGAIELALSARALNDAERAKGLQAIPYARTPIAFATNPEAGTREITLAQVEQIFRGKLLNWPNGKTIRLIRREPSDADWGMLRALSPELTDAVKIALERPGLLTVATDQENADSIERLSGAFGAISLGQIRAESRNVVPLTLDGEPPTTEALAANRYKLSRTLYVVWHDQPGVDAAAFVAFLGTAQAKDILARLGHIPLAGAA
ncbi:MAG TPA: substrate-binding domain-containing protein [Acetobacteraceae bacterium]|nr:substrate-binding domain-containing protein [Acetobacteraceae bacterium]